MVGHPSRRPAVIRSSALQAARADHAAPSPASSSAASWMPIMKRRKKMSPLPGITSTSDPNVVRPNDSSRHAASATSSARAFASRRRQRAGQYEPDGGEQRHDREPAVIEQLAGDQPAEHPAGAVAVLEWRAAQNLVGRRPLPLRQQRHDHPRRRDQRPGHEHRRPADAGGEWRRLPPTARARAGSARDTRSRNAARSSTTRARRPRTRGGLYGSPASQAPTPAAASSTPTAASTPRTRSTHTRAARSRSRWR